MINQHRSDTGAVSVNLQQIGGCSLACSVDASLLGISPMGTSIVCSMPLRTR
jgi:hypothetical protein